MELKIKKVQAKWKKAMMSSAPAYTNDLYAFGHRSFAYSRTNKTAAS